MSPISSYPGAIQPTFSAITRRQLITGMVLTTAATLLGVSCSAKKEIPIPENTTDVTGQVDLSKCTYLKSTIHGQRSTGYPRALKVYYAKDTGTFYLEETHKDSPHHHKIFKVLPEEYGETSFTSVTGKGFSFDLRSRILTIHKQNGMPVATYNGMRDEFKGWFVNY
jgi:hypothetical protein